MKLEKLIEEKGGKIIKLTDDIFEEIILECQNNHTFTIYENDIMLGKWCGKCVDKIQSILESFRLEYFIDKEIKNFTYDFVIDGKRKFVIFKSKKMRNDMIENAIENGFNVIVVDDLDKENLENIIWNSIKENIKLTEISNKKQMEKLSHHCQIERKLGNEKDDVGSVIKSAPEPYPVDMRKVIGYIRVSTVMQVQDGFSLEAQEEKIHQEALKMNGFLKNLYIDRGISGGSIEKRLAMEEMLKNLEKGDWVIVNSVSRLARKTKDLLSIVEIIEKNNCHLMIIDLNLDITSPSGKLILTLMGSQAQFEREITSERVKGVLQHLKEQGNLRTKPPFGWKMNEDRSTSASIHVRDEEEQETIKIMRNLRSKHRDITITTFTEVMNREGVNPPRKSKKWYHKHVKEIMKREGII